MAELSVPEMEAAQKIAAVLDANPPIKEQFTNLSDRQRDLIALNPALAEIYLDPNISQHQKKLRALPFLRKYKDELTELEKKRSKTVRHLSVLEATEIGAKVLMEWGEKSPVLEKNDCSRLHKLVAAYKTGEVFFNDDGKDKEAEELLFKDVHPFVVQNDWAKAFENAIDYAEGEITLPYNSCVFEFRITGVTVLVLALQPEGGPICCLGFAENNGIWFCTGKEAAEEGPFQLAWKEIRAICIALEAQAATHELQRAPAKLNRIREEEGKVPLYSYHVVKLSERHRASAKRFGGVHKSPRLHFRRGHWRHFETHKTWIKWMLVGNPELGFVDKEYRL